MSYLSALLVVQEVGPVRICLHKSKMKEFSQAQAEYTGTDLRIAC